MSDREPPTWWTQFRRELDILGIRRLSSYRWVIALETRRHGRASPEQGARIVQQAPFR